METDFQKFLDELRARVSVAEVVGANVKLVRKGREYMGLCPVSYTHLTLPTIPPV